MNTTVQQFAIHFSSHRHNETARSRATWLDDVVAEAGKTRRLPRGPNRSRRASVRRPAGTPARGRGARPREGEGPRCRRGVGRGRPGGVGGTASGLVSGATLPIDRERLGGPARSLAPRAPSPPGAPQRAAHRRRADPAARSGHAPRGSHRRRLPAPRGQKEK